MADVRKFGVRLYLEVEVDIDDLPPTAPAHGMSYEEQREQFKDNLFEVVSDEADMLDLPYSLTAYAYDPDDRTPVVTD